MDIDQDITLACDPAVAHAELRGLDGYPGWLGIVSHVTPSAPAPGDEGTAWSVELTGGVGPVRLRKRVRMIRTVESPDQLRFDRREADGGDHHAWTLDVGLTPDGDGTRVHVALHYGGTLPPLVDRLLAGELGRAGPRLARRVTA